MPPDHSYARLSETKTDFKRLFNFLDFPRFPFIYNHKRIYHNVKITLKVKGLPNLIFSLPGFDGWNTWEWPHGAAEPSSPGVGWQETRAAIVTPRPAGLWWAPGKWGIEIAPCPGRRWPRCGPGIAGTQCENRAVFWDSVPCHRTCLKNRVTFH